LATIGVKIFGRLADEQDIGKLMTANYGVSLQGINNAWMDIQRSAEHIATGRSESSPRAISVREDSIEISGKAETAPSVDYAQELASVIRAQTALSANLKVIKAEEILSQEILSVAPKPKPGTTEL
jgi:hypothetical protein